MSEEKKAGVFGKLWKAAKDLDFLNWIRPLEYKVGGRKMLLGGGALYILQAMFADGVFTWPKAVSALAVGLTSVGISIAIAIEGETQEDGNGTEEK